ncbi:MAG: DEAD/DEAH box helicase [Desulfococcaceae bacterium]|jgi:ATP-dependent RNA helicase RhlE|nr:DEAD/DEAH box helicase [Desulfococcaceae bacterium]
MSFQSFHFHPSVVSGITAAGYSVPTPIQAKSIPHIMEASDLMGLAQTGTGKTAAFALPILHRLMKGKSRGRVRALVIAPTRELAEQIAQSFDELGRDTRLRTLSIYGGVGISPQIQKLRRGVDIVVACPGRLLDHIKNRNIDLSHVETLVLDEADHMFDMGFLPDIRRILHHIPQTRQTLLFSATMPDEIRKLASDVLHKPLTVQIGISAPADTVSHALYPVAQHLKTPLLLKLLGDTDTDGSVLVFTRTKHRARHLGEVLIKAGYSSASLQGNLSQGRRQAALDGFRSGKFRILVATDIAARGIDISRISHVINFDIPDTPDAYIHRIGRTGRAAGTGDAFTLITGEDAHIVRAISRVVGHPIERRTLNDFDYNIPASQKQKRDVRRTGQRTTAGPSPKAKKSFGSPGGSKSSYPGHRNRNTGRTAYTGSAGQKNRRPSGRA